MPSEDAESLKSTVNDLINQKKLKGTWDPCYWQVTLALIAALRLPDISVANLLQDQGAELSPRSLVSFVNKGNAKLLRFVVRELQEAGAWRPDDWHTGLALAEAWFFERKKLYTVFAENGVVFMPEWLVTAVKFGDIGIIVKIVHGLKATGRWDPSSPFIVKALSEAIKEDANIWYFCLLEEGVKPYPEHLTTAVRHGDCNILKDIIQKLKRQGVWKINQTTRDIMLALEEACLKKDITAYTTLVEEGAEPDFHSLLIAVKADYYQLAARIVRDLKLCGKWNENVIKNDWSLALAKDYIANLPNDSRQTWEHLLFGSANTPVIRTHDANEVKQGDVEDDDEDAVDLYTYEEPTDETLYRSLHRSVSAPVAENEYPSNERGTAGETRRRRHSTEPRDIIPSHGDKIILFPGTGDESIARSSAYTAEDVGDEVDGYSQDSGEICSTSDKHQPLDRGDFIGDVHSLARESILNMRQAFSNDDNVNGESVSPYGTPGVLGHLLDRLTSSSSRSLSRGLGSVRFQRYNDTEMMRLRRQFSFSIRSIPLTVSYADHLRYITKLKF